MDVYEVGGALRDELLGLEVTDRDWVVVGETPAAMRRRGFRQVGKSFPVFLHPETNEEYALARTERKTAPGYRGFEVCADPDVTLHEDLARRDLTVNAIARGTAGNWIDPFDGIGDIERRVLRHVSDAFVEDPVRVLRVARFAARFCRLGFRIADETLALMRQIVDAGEVGALVAERAWAETRRALGTDDPQVYFETLRECGALAVVFPEIDALFGVPQPRRWHPEIDTGVHTMMVVSQAAGLSRDTRVRFAALVHDLGKAETPADILPSHRGHEARSLPLVRALCARLRIPNDFRELALMVAEHHGKVHRAAELKPRTIVRLLSATDALRRPERFNRFLLACEADARGRTGLEDRPYPQATLLRRARDAAARVGTESIDTAGLAGAEIGRALETRRIDAVRAALSDPS